MGIRALTGLFEGERSMTETMPTSAIRKKPSLQRNGANMRKASFILLTLFVCACAQGGGADDTPTGSASIAIANGDRPIGGPCEPEDGWTPSSVSNDRGSTTDAVNEPVALPVPDGYVEQNQLPPGIGYCMLTAVYPDGYFTMNCDADSDCPGDAVCDGKRCRAPCVSDTDCVAPNVCGPPTGSRKVRHCSWRDSPDLRSY